ncbi:hypothetical protein PROFUN_06327 [Planoprotostelium fungivorum]|uniref:Delta(24)-sterol reductase n=1 Tax=Planoprotostelium fungivorum TaxID=1890364 RepID=A0A2P6NP48_9EUKA|nr:hypothetical protein PROFUN_06327 [Planoprotostelium fungivorum]
MTPDRKIKIIASVAWALFLGILELPLRLWRDVLAPLWSDPLRPVWGLDPPAPYKSQRQHDADVKEIIEHLKKARESGKEVVIGRKVGEGHSARSGRYKEKAFRVDMTKLDSVLELDVESRRAVCEPFVSFSALSSLTLPHNLLPLVVPEFRRITVGGAIQGLGIESTSYRNSTFDTTLVDTTLLTGRGDVIRSSEHPRLWRSVPGSNGTVALTLSTEVKLTPATEWVRLRYVKYASPLEFTRESNRKVEEYNRGEKEENWIGNDKLMDGVGFPWGTIGMFGGCVTKEDARRLHRSGMPIYRQGPASDLYYRHIEDIGKGGGHVTPEAFEEHLEKYGELLHEELIPTPVYLFRYDRGGFWGITALPKFFPSLASLLSNRIFHTVLTTLVSTATLYKIAMLVSDQTREGSAILQDLDIPPSGVKKLLRWNDDTLGIWPLWLCPVACSQDKRTFGLGRSEDIKSVEDMYAMNVGVYGAPSNGGYPLFDANIQLEKLVASLGGKKALYAFVYSDREVFWSWYDAREYEELREEYGGKNVFMGLWEKVSKPMG